MLRFCFPRSCHRSFIRRVSRYKTFSSTRLQFFHTRKSLFQQQQNQQQQQQQQQQNTVSPSSDSLKPLPVSEFFKDFKDRPENLIERIYFAVTVKEVEILCEKLKNVCPQLPDHAYDTIIFALLTKNASDSALPYLLEAKEKNILLSSRTYHVVVSRLLDNFNDLYLYFLREMLKHHCSSAIKILEKHLYDLKKKRDFKKIVHIWDTIKQIPNLDIRNDCYILIIMGLYGEERPERYEEIYQVYERLQKKQSTFNPFVIEILLLTCLELGKDSDLMKLLNLPIFKENYLPFSLGVVLLEIYARFQQPDKAREILQKHILCVRYFDPKYASRILKAVVKLNLWKEGSEFVKRVSFLKIETTSDAQQIIELSVVILCQAHLGHLAAWLVQKCQKTTSITPNTFQRLSAYFNEIGDVKRANQYAQLATLSSISPPENN